MEERERAAREAERARQAIRQKEAELAAIEAERRQQVRSRYRSTALLLVGGRPRLKSGARPGGQPSDSNSDKGPYRLVARCRGQRLRSGVGPRGQPFLYIPPCCPPGPCPAAHSLGRTEAEAAWSTSLMLPVPRCQLARCAGGRGGGAAQSCRGQGAGGAPERAADPAAADQGAAGEVSERRGEGVRESGSERGGGRGE